MSFVANNYSIQGSTLCGELRNLIDLACTLERSYGFVARGWPLMSVDWLVQVSALMQFFSPVRYKFQSLLGNLFFFSCFYFHVLFRRLSELNWNVKLKSRAETERTMSLLCVCSCSFISLSCRYEPGRRKMEKIIRRLLWMCEQRRWLLVQLQTATCLFPVTSAPAMMRNCCENKSIVFLF